MAGRALLRLSGGKALWNMAHLTVPAVADYRERISLYFDKGFLDLEFPSPWLNHQPARLTITTSEGHVLSTAELRAGYESPFVEELIGFWAAIINGEPVRNPAEDARRDISLLADMVRWHHGKGLRRAPHPASLTKPRTGATPLQNRLRGDRVKDRTECQANRKTAQTMGPA